MSKLKSGNVKKTEDKLCEILNNLTGKTFLSINNFESRDLIRAITTNFIETSAKNITGIHNLNQNMVKERTNERLSQNEPNQKKKYLNSLIINFDDLFRYNYYELREL